MRTINIDFSNQSTLYNETFAGYIGEHNATSLKITPPDEFKNNTNVVSYVVAFKVGQTPVRSKVFSKSNTITVKLWKQLTESRRLSVQLEARDLNGNLIAKTVTVQLNLLPSVPDSTKDNLNIDSNDIISEIAHANRDVLDKFSESNGYVLFDGEKIAVDLDVDDTISEDSVNPVQNKVIKEALDNKVDQKDFDKVVLPNIEVAEETDDTYVLKLINKNGHFNSPNLKGEQGFSGVYVGSGDMPDGYNVQIDPNGEVAIIPTKTSELENDRGFITSDDLPEGTGVTNHSLLTNRDAENQHPILAIENLQGELDNRRKLSEMIPATEVSYSNEALGEVENVGDSLDAIVTGFDSELNKMYDVFAEKDSLENNYAKKLDIPTKTSQLTNDSGYVTNTELNEALAEVNFKADIPDYWQSAVDGAISKVKSLQDDIGSKAVNFVLFSDMHYQNTDSVLPFVQNLGVLSATLMDECDIPLVLMAGDTARSGVAASESTIIADLEGANEVLSPIGNERLLQIRGNHDDVWGKSADGTVSYVNKIKPSKIYNLIHRKQACDFRRVFGGDGTYFYVDNIPQKTRFICLNSHYYNGEEITEGTTKVMTTGLGTEQLEWLADEALPIDKNGWSVIIATHVPPTASNINGRTDYLKQYSDGTDFRGIITAYCNASTYSGTTSVDYTNKNTAEVIGVFCGHCHYDAIVSNDLPCPIVTITCAAPLSYDNTEADRTAGSDTETALDIVTIDKENKHIHLSRLGIGSDRVCSYGGEVITTHFITANLTNVISDNSSTIATSGTPYTATLTAKTGYELSTATVTMGGTDITETAYNNGVISIPSVTGDIVITAEAVVVLNYTNQLAIATDTDGSILNGIGYVEGYRISSSSSSVSENTATDLTGFIPCKRGDVIRLKNITFPISTSNVGVHFYADDKTTKTYSFIANAWAMSAFEAVIDGTNLTQFTLPAADAWNEPGDFVYIRICASDINSESIITVNEEIT